MKRDGFLWQMARVLPLPLILIYDIATGHYGWAIITATANLVWVLLTSAELWMRAELYRLELEIERKGLSDV